MDAMPDALAAGNVSSDGIAEAFRRLMRVWLSAYIVLVYIVMAYHRGLPSAHARIVIGLYNSGLYSYGLLPRPSVGSCAYSYRPM